MKARSVLAFVLFALGGCERAMHDMYDQPKLKPGSPSTLFADARAARTPPDGSVAHSRGVEADLSSGRNGLAERAPTASEPEPLGDDGRPLARGAAGDRGERRSNPRPLTLTLLERGRERYGIFCAPCHGKTGDGDGRVVQRGFPAPPSYHDPRLRAAPDGHFFDVISRGYGVMYPYADRVAPDDRWAIVAYIRALQMSRNAPRDVLDEADLARLLAGGNGHEGGAR